MITRDVLEMKLRCVAFFLHDGRRWNPSQNKPAGLFIQCKEVNRSNRGIPSFAVCMLPRQVVDVMHLKTSMRRISGAKARTLRTGSGADTDPAGRRTTAVCRKLQLAPAVFCGMVLSFSFRDKTMLVALLHQRSSV